jgi:hypothetical protein
LQWRKIVAMAHRRIGKGSASEGSTAQRATERAIRERERKRKRESERTRREGGREVERGVGTK